MNEAAIKLTDAASLNLASFQVQYSSKSPFNCDCSKVLILGPQCFHLWDVTTRQRICPLEWLGDSAEPLWDKANPNKLYYHAGNKLMVYCVDTNVHDVIHTFGEYVEISGKGESALSEDGNHLVLCGDNREIFVYQLDTDGKGLTGDTSEGFDSVYIIPDNNVLVSGVGGMFLFDRDMKFLRKIGGNNGHKGVMRDTNGDECLVWIDNTDNVIKKIRLADNVALPLITLDWSLACHISCPRKGDFCLVETYDPHNPVFTKLDDNAIIKLPLDGTASTELLKHGSNASNYNGQPRVSISDDGSRFVYGSNMGGTVTNVYLGDLGNPISPAPSLIGADLPFVSQDERPELKPNSAVQWYRPSSGEDGVLFFDATNYRYFYAVENDGVVKVRINP